MVKYWTRQGGALLLATLLGTTLLGTAGAAAQEPVKLGVLTDMSGMLSDMSGQGSVEAAKLAIEDFGGTALGQPVELVFADHQHKADVGVAVAREWYENDGVDVILDVPNSSIALAIAALAAEEKKLAIFASAATDKLTEENCTGYGLHWTFNLKVQTVTTTKALIENGYDTWFIFASDYAFGLAQEAAIREAVEANGGTVLGGVRHPFGNQDFASYLLQAQASGAKMIGLASSGDDIINAIRQAHEFGLTQSGVKLGSMVNLITETHTIGLEFMQGMQVAVGFYWDLDDQSRAFANRFYERIGRMPTEMQAGVYSATLQYLAAVEAAGTTDADAVKAKLMEMEVNDAYIRNGKLLANGRMVHDMLLLEVKKPEESKYPWDYYHVLRVIPAGEAFPPLSESKCPLVAQQ